MARTEWFSALIMTLAFVVAAFFVSYPLYYDWDELFYLVDIFRGEPADLILGRGGYIYPAHWLWLGWRNFHSNEFHPGFSELLRTINILFSAAALTSVILIMRRLGASLLLAALTFCLVLARPHALLMSTAHGPDPVMYGSLAVAFYCMLRAHQDKKNHFAFAAAFLAAFAFAAHERALFWAPAFVLIPFLVPKTSRFSNATYIKLLLFTLILMSLPPVLLYLSHPQDYLQNLISSNNATNFNGETFQVKLQSVTNIPFSDSVSENILGGLGAIVALVLVYKRKNWMPATFTFLATAATTIFCFWILSSAALSEIRFFLPQYFLFALFGAMLIEQLLSLRKPWWGFGLLLSVAILAIIVTNSFDMLRKLRAPEIEKQQVTDSRYERWKQYLNKKSTFFISYDDNNLFYRSMVNNSPIRTIFQGWDWPTEDKLREIIQFSHSKRRRVFWPLEGPWSPENIRDIEALRDEFNFEQIDPELIEIKPKTPITQH